MKIWYYGQCSVMLKMCQFAPDPIRELTIVD